MDVQERNRLVVQHLRIVGEQVRKIKRQAPAMVEPADLFQAGVIGLMRAVERWDPDKGNLYHFARIRIHGALLDHLRSLDYWNRRHYRLLQKQGVFVLSMERLPLLHSRGEEEAVGDRGWIDPGAPVGAELEEQDEWNYATRGLDAVGKQMVVLHFLEGLTMKDVGEKLGYSESRVCQRILNWKAQARAHQTTNR